MRRIPDNVRRQLANDPFMWACIHQQFKLGPCECDGRIEWHHPFIYAGKQIVDAWATVPLCSYHHREALNSDFARYVALLRATDDDLAQYPRTNWAHMKRRLQTIYGEYTIERAEWLSDYARYLGGAFDWTGA
jgi:hypothetical protein